MACQSCSSNVSSGSSGGSYSTPGSGACGCQNQIAPPRSSNPPVVPVAFPWVARVRNFLCGKLLIRRGDEIGALDSAISGQVLFDAQTGNVHVGSMEVNDVADNFACDSPTGFPLYGVTPDCRDMGENPTRAIAIMRPENSDIGNLYGHETQCPATTGLRPEIKPVQIIPGEYDEDAAPTGMFNLAYVDVPADACKPATRKWYAVPPQFSNSVDLADIELYDVPEGPLSAANDATFGLGVWVKNDDGTKWVLQKVTNESLQTLIGAGSPFKFIRPRPTIYSQYRVDGNAPTPVNQNIDLTTQPEYFANASAVMLTVTLFALSGTRVFRMNAYVDDELFSSISCRPSSSNDNTNTFIVPIPPSKQINFKLTETPDVAGTYDDFFVDLTIDAFVK